MEPGRGVLVLCGDRGRVVALEGRQGPDAARAVAVVLIDLAQAGLPPPTPPAPPTATAATDTPPRVVVPRELPRTRPKSHARGYVGGLLSRGASAADAILPGVIVGGELRLGRVWIGTEFAYSGVRPADGAIEPDVTTSAMRLSAGLSAGPWIGGARATLSRVTIGRTADYTRSLLAGGLIVARDLRVGQGAWIRLAMTADAYTRRVSVDYLGAAVFTTPRVEVAGSVSFAWRFGGR